MVSRILVQLGFMASVALVAAVVLDADPCYAMRFVGSRFTVHSAGGVATARATNAGGPLSLRPTRSRVWLIPSHKTGAAQVRRAVPSFTQPPLSSVRNATVCASTP